MEFRLDDDQVALSDTVRRFCADRFALDRVGEREQHPVDRGVWRDLADLGVFGLLLPELAGESVYGAVGAAIVFEELGAHLATGPLAWSVLAAPHVEAAATGEAVVGGLVLPAEGSASDVPVAYAADLDVVVVADDSGVRLVAGEDLPAPRELVPFDPLTPVGCFDDLPGGESVAGPDDAARLRLLGATLSAATAVGVAARALEVARTYALEREQFDVPIGSFQAIKHILADMYVRTNLARGAAYAAAAVVDDPGTGDAVRAVAGAKVLATDAAIANGKAAVQVLGGMGFTWDMLPNYLLKRAWVLEHAFGSADDHALAISAALEAELEGTTP